MSSSTRRLALSLVLASLVSVAGVAELIAGADGPAPGTTGQCLVDQLLVKFRPGVDPNAASAWHGATIISQIRALEVYVLEVPSGTVAQKVAEFGADPEVEYAEPNGIAHVAPSGGSNRRSGS